MSNLKDNLTRKEWEELESELKRNSDNGKPNNEFLNLCLENKTLDELKTIKNVLKGIYSDLSLNNLNLWIKYKSK